MISFFDNQKIQAKAGSLEIYQKIEKQAASLKGVKGQEKAKNRNLLFFWYPIWDSYLGGNGMLNLAKI